MRIGKPQQPHPQQGDEQGGAHVRNDGHPHRPPAQQYDDEKDKFNANAQRHINANRAHGGAAQAHGKGQSTQVGIHQGDICGLHRLRGACRTTNRNADIGGSQGWGVVNPIANHCDRAMFPLQAANRCQFIGGQQLGTHISYPHLAADCVGRALVVARQHDDLCNAGGFELADCDATAEAYTVGQGNRTAVSAINTE